MQPKNHKGMSNPQEQPSQRSRRLKALALLLMASIAAHSPDCFADDAFPMAQPEQVGLSPEALQLLDEQVHSLVDDNSIVGAELHVIQNRKTVLHQAYGWADREDQRPMAVNSTFCIRSMTKPLTGTAIQMLVDQGKLKLEDKASSYLPSFRGDPLDKISIQHLLEHRSGLPMSAISKPLDEYQSIIEVADDGAQAGVDFPPGAQFQYSDAGSETLSAVAQQITGKDFGSFVQDNLLDPLGMDSALPLLNPDSNETLEIPSAYSGGINNWQRHWKRSDKAMFPLFLGSQGLYCTTTDYAKFLAMWMDNGIADDKQILSEAAIQRGLAPASPFHYPAGFSGLSLSYGQQWMVFHKPGSDEVEMFGHNGSDGTYAWACPKQDLIILFFTQSRGTVSGLELATAIDRLLLKGDVDNFRKDLYAKTEARKQLRRFEGLYWDEDKAGDYYAISTENNTLVMERPGAMRIAAKSTAKEGEFSIAGGALKLNFDLAQRPAGSMKMSSGGKHEMQVRHQPPTDTPSIDAVIEKVVAAHSVDNIKQAGIVHQAGKITMGMMSQSGTIDQWFDKRRTRLELNLGPNKIVVVANGQEAATSINGGPMTYMEGPARQQQVLNHPLIRMADWRDHFEDLSVLKTLASDQGEQILVRAVATRSKPDH